MLGNSTAYSEPGRQNPGVADTRVKYKRRCSIALVHVDRGSVNAAF